MQGIIIYTLLNMRGCQNVSDDIIVTKVQVRLVVMYSTVCASSGSVTRFCSSILNPESNPLIISKALMLVNLGFLGHFSVSDSEQCMVGLESAWLCAVYHYHTANIQALLQYTNRGSWQVQSQINYFTANKLSIPGKVYMYSAYSSLYGYTTKHLNIYCSITQLHKVV